MPAKRALPSGRQLAGYRLFDHDAAGAGERENRLTNLVRVR